MDRKTHIDVLGAVALTLFSLNLGFNQVVVKFANGGFQPVFMAGLRSVGALVLLGLTLFIYGLKLALFPVGENLAHALADHRLRRDWRRSRQTRASFRRENHRGAPLTGDFRVYSTS